MKQLYLLFLAFLCLKVQVHAQKQVYLPRAFSTDPALSTWSYDRSAQSANFICFWGAKVGNDPSVYSDPNLRFSPAAVLDTLEKNYTKFIRDIRFCSDDTGTNLGKYKIIIIMNATWPPGGPTGWAFGGQYDNVIGAMWVHPAATRDGGALSHELTHSLQAQNNIDRNKVGGFRTETSGFFWEAHANFMRSQMYPHYLKDDLPRWMATSSYHYSSTRHHYGALNLLYTIQQLDSLGMINRLWHESIESEHPLMTYRRLKGWSQSGLNDFIYEYAKREVIADYSVLSAGEIIRAERRRIKANEPHYLWRQYTMLKRMNDSSGRYIVPDELAPQDYGYNIIPLHATCSDRTVKIKFKGHTEVNTAAGWRYGFVAEKSDGKTARYSAMYSGDETEAAFRMNDDEVKLYLVVVGAPKTHTSYVWEAGFPKIRRYPYELTIQNAVPEGYQETYRAEYRTNGRKHANGGGWVNNGATVASSVFVGPNAIVRSGSNLSGNVRIEDNAWVEGATLSDNVVVKGNANVYYGTYSGNVVVSENAILNYCTVSGSAQIKGNALEWGVTLGNAVVVGGDAEIGSCSTNGVYLQTPHHNNGRSACDGKGASDPSNIDINAPVVPFSDAQMAIAYPVACRNYNTVPNLALIAKASTSYVSPWENLAAVNDGFTPASSSDKSHGAYGNWPSPDAIQWVQYDWDSTYTLSKSDIYWFDDGGGVLVPTTAYIEYWNGTAWIKAGDVPLTKDAFNTLSLAGISTKRIRVSMKNTSQSTGILEWRVWQAVEKPVEPYVLLSFTGKRVNGSNELLWEVANEDSISRYEVEYSNDSVYYNKVATVIANSNAAHTYQFSHRSGSLHSYYRIKEVHASGSVSYSPLVKLSISTAVPNLALIAKASTSYVSPWENLAAVNDGFTPASSSDKSHGAYGNWPSPDAIQWVQYDWDSTYTLSRSDIYWFDDGGGVLVPTTAYIEYWNGSSWIKLSDVPLVKDTFNTVVINQVATRKIRVSMKNTHQSTGILEWRVWGAPEQTIEPYRLIAFNGTGSSSGNLLTWKVAHEDSIARYEVEYSADSLQFAPAGTVTAGNHAAQTYRFTHHSTSADSYYRLKQVSDSGRVMLSSVVKLSYAKVGSFNGAFYRGNNVLQWKAENEHLLHSYEVEYSTDSIHYTRVGVVNANTNSAHTYEFVHKANDKVAYYRLKLVGNDGTVSYSSMLRMKGGNLDKSIRLYTNPVVDNLVLLSELDKQYRATVLIQDVFENVVDTRSNMVFPEGRWTTSIPVQSLRKGVYVVTIIFEGEAERVSLKFVKE